MYKARICYSKKAVTIIVFSMCAEKEIRILICIHIIMKIELIADFDKANFKICTTFAWKYKIQILMTILQNEPLFVQKCVLVSKYKQ